LSKYIPVEGFSGLVRDTESNAILNIDTVSVEQARERKRLRRQKRDEDLQLKDRVEKIESDMGEIKNLLKILVEKDYK
jgi:hypothetical protein